MPDIVICEFMDEGAIRDGLAGFDVLYDPALVGRPADLAAALVDARVLIVRNRTQVRGDLLAAAARLRAIGRLGVGLDNIDLDACRARDIAVYPATGANDVAVAEYVLAAAMTLLREAFGATGEVVEGGWPRERLSSGREIAGKRLGLVGYGSTARAVASRAAALGMTVGAHDPYVAADHPSWAGVERLPLDALLAGSDVISLHVPLTPETRGLVDAARLDGCRPGTILVNAARGGVVDEAALAAALRSGRLGGAALDVFEGEPLSAARGAVFAGCPNLILTPHIAGVTAEANVRVSNLIASRIRDHLGKLSR